MNPIDAINDLQDVTRRSLPPGLRGLARWKIDRITVKITDKTLCRAGRLVQHIVGLVATWTDTEVDDKATQIIDQVLDSFGCEG